MEGLKILIVDDEPDIVEMLSYNFENEKMLVQKALNGREALEKAETFKPDVILLDVMLPDIDGIEVCERIRNIEGLKDSYVIFLSARGEDYSQVAGYKAGGDDYVVKPVRIKILKHKVAAFANRFKVGDIFFDSDISIDKEKFVVSKEGVDHVIPKKEFELLALLMSTPEKVFRREEILRDVWGDTVIGDRTIDVHVRKLREKFGDEVIQTIKGVGYKFAG
ncbi:response regulator transcription factor [Paracrocinitomix mangrovi]|uniref:response regulator transcription factor n=1 Tax=Paracrocinitomix mangrovi TaxID=2862509 RepID=UPI001C8EBDB4|nr:response regulator transcription factor [Paracrocinitomix mangrovi]UKN00933.1 response regulator transcription factor [Paracrocinitomix mangrovi]